MINQSSDIFFVAYRTKPHQRSGPALGGGGRGGRPGPRTQGGPKSQLGRYTCFMLRRQRHQSRSKEEFSILVQPRRSVMHEGRSERSWALFIFVRWSLFTGQHLTFYLQTRTKFNRWGAHGYTMAGARSYTQRIFLANKNLIHIPFLSFISLIVG